MGLINLFLDLPTGVVEVAEGSVYQAESIDEAEGVHEHACTSHALSLAHVMNQSPR